MYAAVYGFSIGKYGFGIKIMCLSVNIRISVYSLITYKNVCLIVLHLEAQ